MYTYTVFIICCILFLIYIYNNELNKQKETFSNDFNQFNNPKPNAHSIYIYDDFINSNECNKLIELSNGNFIQSTVYSSNNDKSNASSFIDEKSRSSTNYYFKRAENDLIRKIENKVCDFLNINLDQIEPLQIAKYEKGQEYKYHYDYFDKTDNQRQYSIIIYLNDLDEQDGGATHFSLYKCKFFPYKGRAIQWNNINPDKSLNKLSLHAGQPILTDKTKYILTIWTREYSL
jgi:prolyl 4-hydroxylase